MRSVLIGIFLFGLLVAFGAVSSQRQQEAPRFVPPAVVSVVEAIYPLQSVAAGTVVLEISLDETGKVIDVRVVRGIPSLTEPAEQSVRQWKFQPAELDGKQVPSKVPVAFSFVPPTFGPRR
jgi:TonB family protein